MNCKNCNAPLQGKFCSDCGQSASVTKLRMTKLIKDLFYSIFQVDKGFFFTFIAMISRPGNAIREYLDGKRVKYYQPISYVLVLSTIYFLVSKLVGDNTWMHEIIMGVGEGIAKEGATIPTFFFWFARNFAYTTLILLPVFSFCSFLCFKKFEVNYTEHFVLNAFVAGQQALIYLTFAILKKLTNVPIMEVMALCFSPIYAGWVFGQFFNNASRVSVLLRTFLTYILYFLACFVIALIFVSVINIA